MTSGTGVAATLQRLSLARILSMLKEEQEQDILLNSCDVMFVVVLDSNVALCRLTHYATTSIIPQPREGHYDSHSLIHIRKQ